MASIGVDDPSGKKEKRRKKESADGKKENKDIEDTPAVSSTPVDKQRKKGNKEQSNMKFAFGFDTHDQQSEQTASVGADAKSAKKEKRHKKKSTDDRKCNEDMHTVSSMSANRKKGKNEQSEISVCADDAREHLKTVITDTPCPETSNFPVKNKEGKKRKKLQSEHSKGDKVATQENNDVDTAFDLVKKSRKKKKKLKQDADGDDATDSSKACSSQYRALEYLRTWKSAPDSWTFQKVRQVWLLQNMYDTTKVRKLIVCSTYNLEFLIALA